MKVDILTFWQKVQRQNNYFDIEIWIVKKHVLYWTLRF